MTQDTVVCVQEAMQKLLANPGIQKALAFIKEDEANTFEELKEMVLMHGESFKEHLLRSPMYKAKLEKYGAVDCAIDDEGNVLGYVHGKARPKILMEAHLDTVFKESTPLEITEKDGRFFCPGISDDTSSLAANLSILRAIKHAGLKPVGTLAIGGTVGEEGEGNARGIRALMRNHGDIDAALAVECYDEAYLILGAVGIKRYEITFKGPGGHSWSAFGLPNPIHAMGRAIAKISDLHTLASPKTTFSVGTVTGGTSINSIPYECSLKLDMRSVDLAELDKLDATVLALLDMAVAEENLRWKNEKRVSVEVKTIGNKPAGEVSRDSVIAQVAIACTEAVGSKAHIAGPSSTNQNIPVSMGIPAVVVGAGGKSGAHHSLDEWYEPKNAHKGAQKVLLMLFALAGLEGVCEPLAEPCLERGPVR